MEFCDGEITLPNKRLDFVRRTARLAFPEMFLQVVSQFFLDPLSSSYPTEIGLSREAYVKGFQSYTSSLESSDV